MRGLSNLVESVDKHSGKKCLNLNVKKTKLMKTDKAKEDLEIKDNGETLEIVSRYVYLGCTISEDKVGREEKRKRLAMAMHKQTKMKFLWKGQDAQTKLRILRACIFPVATYGCQAWALGKTNLKRINAFEMKCYRKMIRNSWTEHRMNKSVREELQVEEQWLENFVRREKLKYFGHLKRSEGLGKIILEEG